MRPLTRTAIATLTLSTMAVGVAVTAAASAPGATDPIAVTARVPVIAPVPTTGPALLPAPLRPTASAASSTDDGPSTLALRLTSPTAGGVRSGPVIFTLACTDGVTATWRVPATATLPVTSGTLSFDHETTCSVTQTATAGATLVRWTYANPEGQRSGVGADATIALWHGNYPGTAYTLTFANSYASATPSPSTSATPEPSATPQPSASPTASASASATATPTPSSSPGTTDPTTPDRRPQQPVGLPDVPSTIDPSKPLVVLPGRVITDAGNRVRSTVFCSPVRGGQERVKPTGDAGPACRVIARSDGSLRLRLNVTTPTRVWVVRFAPASPGYLPYLRVITRVVEPKP